MIKVHIARVAFMKFDLVHVPTRFPLINMPYRLKLMAHNITLHTLQSCNHLWMTLKQQLLF